MSGPDRTLGIGLPDSPPASGVLLDWSGRDGVRHWGGGTLRPCRSCGRATLLVDADGLATAQDVRRSGASRLRRAGRVVSGEQTRWLRSERARLSVVDRHLEDLRLLGHKPDTINCRRLALRRMAAVLPVPLLAATAEDLALWRARLAVAPNTIVAYVSHARQFYAWAVAEGLRDDNPTERLSVPRQSRRLPRPITGRHLDGREVGGGQVMPGLEIGHRVADLSLGRVGPGALQPTADLALGELLAAGLPAAGWVFLRRDGVYGPNKPWMVSHLCNQYLHECGIQASLHRLRHRFGTQAYQVSHDLRAVQELLGHAHPQTTAGYAAWSNASAEAAVNALPIPPGSAAARQISADQPRVTPGAGDPQP